MEKKPRIAISFTADQRKRFEALAEFDEKRLATLAAEIILSYMDTRAGDIDSVLRVKAEYEMSVKKLRNTNTADKSPAQ